MIECEILFQIKNNWKDLWEPIATLISIFIAIGAVTFSGIQTRISNKQNFLLVRPYLDTRAVENPDDKTGINILLLNTGLGPAIIEDYVILSEGKEYRDKVAIEGLFQNFFNSAYPATFRPKSSIKAGDSEVILRIEATSNNQLEEFLKQNFELKIKYKSLLNEAQPIYSTSNHTWEIKS